MDEEDDEAEEGEGEYEGGVEEDGGGVRRKMMERGRMRKMGRR